jgi:hypothetical protein
VIEQIATAATDETFRNSVLSRALERSANRLNSDGFHGLDNFGVEDSVAAVDEVFWRRVIGKRFTQLLRYPCAGWMASHIEVEHAPPVVADDKETREHTEGERWHGEEIHRGDGLAMVVQKRRPSFDRLRIPRSLPHPAHHRSPRDVEAKNFQLSMNAGCAPSRILCKHAENEFAQFPADTFSSHLDPVPRKPRPIQFEPSPVPANDSLRLNENQRPPPSRPESPQHHPEQPVWNGKLPGFCSRSHPSRVPHCRHASLTASFRLLRR